MGRDLLPRAFGRYAILLLGLLLPLLWTGCDAPAAVSSRPNIVGVWELVSGADFIGYGGVPGLQYQIFDDGRIETVANPDPQKTSHSFKYLWTDDKHISVSDNATGLKFDYLLTMQNDQLIVDGVQLPYRTTFKRIK